MRQSIPRPEHPNPQQRRENWQNLNGTWDFAYDPGESGIEREMYAQSASFPHQITVPFCPESELSGQNRKDFLSAVWYRRRIAIEKEQLSGQTVLHLGAVDYDSKIWVNEKLAGSHQGGYSSFEVDITPFLQAGENTLVIHASDELRSGRQPAGKQSDRYHSYACSYTRTTGIWQTVWLEFRPHTHIGAFKLRPDYKNRRLQVEASVENLASDETASFSVCLIDPQDQKVIAKETINAQQGENRLSLVAPNPESIKPWQPGQAQLYDVKLELKPNQSHSVDTIHSYCGFRDLEWRAAGLYLNGQPVFQRLILDQGFYPDGIYTAPDDDALRRDIELSQKLGFNGARLHQKVFEPRFLYWADKLGYLVWGEQGSWQLDISRPEALIRFLPEWTEVVARDINHPSIIGWCPFNETWDYEGRRQCDAVIRQVYEMTKRLDPDRPVIDTSGNYHIKTDFFDIHDYEQDPDVFAQKFANMKSGGPAYVTYPDRQSYEGQPYFVSEYGGTWWNPEAKDGWGYGNSPQDEAELVRRYQGLTQALLDNPKICAFCYTQLTDVEQEQNGLYRYDRTEKFSAKVYEQIRATNLRPAAIETETST